MQSIISLNYDIKLIADINNAMKVGERDESEFNLQLGHVLKQVRSNSGLTQQELENLTGIQRGYISDLERGQKKISVHKLFQLCEGFAATTPSDVLAKLERRLKNNADIR